MQRRGAYRLVDFKSAWLSDVVMVFFMENTKNLFEESISSGFYRDDRLVFFKGSKVLRN